MFFYLWIHEEYHNSSKKILTLFFLCGKVIVNNQEIFESKVKYINPLIKGLSIKRGVGTGPAIPQQPTYSGVVLIPDRWQ